MLLAARLHRICIDCVQNRFGPLQAFQSTRRIMVKTIMDNTIHIPIMATTTMMITTIGFMHRTTRMMTEMQLTMHVFDDDDDEDDDEEDDSSND